MLHYNFETKKFQTVPGDRYKTVILNPNRYKNLVYVTEGGIEDFAEIIDMYEFREIHVDIFNEMTYKYSDIIQFKYEGYDVVKKIYRHKNNTYSVYSLKLSGS